MFGTRMGNLGCATASSSGWQQGVISSCRGKQKGQSSRETRLKCYGIQLCRSAGLARVAEAQHHDRGGWTRRRGTVAELPISHSAHRVARPYRWRTNLLMDDASGRSTEFRKSWREGFRHGRRDYASPREHQVT